jgi:uncharacterized membrane protein
MSTKAKRQTWILRVGAAHRRLLISAAIGIAAALLLLAAPITAVTRMLIGWDTGVLIYLGVVVALMVRGATVAHMRNNAAAQDEGALAILILAAAAAIASMGAIFAELATVERGDPLYGLYLALAIATVILSWAFIHTIFALHYAHDYYGSGVRKNGLQFPGDGQPDYWDFIYFSFVIGMTFQVSDVAITHRTIRRMVVAHGALSFFFTTAILAMTVNIAAGLIQK